MPAGDADRVRQYLFQRVEEARMAGASSITFRAGDVHDALGLSNAVPNVCQVLENEGKFHRPAGLQFLKYVYRPPSGLGRRLEIEFRILPVSNGVLGSETAPQNIEQESVAGVSSSTDTELEDIPNSNLRESIMKLSPSEFQELAREYLKAKGFDGAEMEITIRMKI